MAQRAISYDHLLRLCVDGLPVTFKRHGVEHNVFRIAGGSPDGDPEDGEGEGDPEGEPNPDPNSGEEPDLNEDAEPVSKAELEALKRRMQAADRRATEAEKKVKEFEDKGKTDLERAQAREKELEAENSALQQQLADTSIRNAFLADNAITWHDPDLAFREIRAALGDDVELDSSGKVPGMDKAIKDLAKSKAWMVKTEAPSGSSGSPQNGGRKGDDKKADRAKLRAQYPALRR